MTTNFFSSNKLAQDWQYDRHQSVLVSRNRWFLACIINTGLNIALGIIIISLLPLKKEIPFVIHENTKTGEFFVTKPATTYRPETDAQTQADITRYIVHRESYMATDLNQRFRIVMLLSSNTVANDYANSQANLNKNSPVNLLGEKGMRIIHIEDIVFLDKEESKELHHFKTPAHNLAKVDFTTTTTDKEGRTLTHYWVATLSWKYFGLPDNQADAWDNWSGFTVTSYRVDQRNIAPTHS